MATTSMTTCFNNVQISSSLVSGLLFFYYTMFFCMSDQVRDEQKISAGTPLCAQVKSVKDSTKREKKNQLIIFSL